jgi:histidinol-phosphate/aromatic aminotransferase/cobyric acid decarboxylase-like protein
MTTNYPAAIFRWRSYTETLDSTQPPHTIKTMLWACEQWLARNQSEWDTETGRRIAEIRAELEAWLEQFGDGQPHG